MGKSRLDSKTPLHPFQLKRWRPHDVQIKSIACSLLPQFVPVFLHVLVPHHSPTDFSEPLETSPHHFRTLHHLELPLNIDYGEQHLDDTLCKLVVHLRLSYGGHWPSTLHPSLIGKHTFVLLQRNTGHPLRCSHLHLHPSIIMQQFTKINPVRNTPPGLLINLLLTICSI